MINNQKLFIKMEFKKGNIWKVCNSLPILVAQLCYLDGFQGSLSEIPEDRIPKNINELIRFTIIPIDIGKCQSDLIPIVEFLSRKPNPHTPTGNFMKECINKVIDILNETYPDWKQYNY